MCELLKTDQGLTSIFWWRYRLLKAMICCLSMLITSTTILSKSPMMSSLGCGKQLSAADLCKDTKYRGISIWSELSDDFDVLSFLCKPGTRIRIGLPAAFSELLPNCFFFSSKLLTAAVIIAVLTSDGAGFCRSRDAVGRLLSTKGSRRSKKCWFRSPEPSRPAARQLAVHVQTLCEPLTSTTNTFPHQQIRWPGFDQVGHKIL